MDDQYTHLKEKVCLSNIESFLILIIIFVID